MINKKLLMEKAYEGELVDLDIMCYSDMFLILKIYNNITYNLKNRDVIFKGNKVKSIKLTLVKNDRYLWSNGWIEIYCESKVLRLTKDEINQII